MWESHTQLNGVGIQFPIRRMKKGEKRSQCIQWYGVGAEMDGFMWAK